MYDLRGLPPFPLSDKKINLAIVACAIAHQIMVGKDKSFQNCIRAFTYQANRKKDKHFSVGLFLPLSSYYFFLFFINVIACLD